MGNIVKEKINIPSCVYIDHIPDDLLNGLKEYCYNDLEQTKGIHICEGKYKTGFLKYAPHTGDESFSMSRNLLLDDKPNESIIELETFINDHIKQIINLDYPSIVNTTNINVDGISYAYYPLGAHIGRHAHFPTTFVSSVYLDVDSNSSPITFSGEYDISVENNKCITHHGLSEHEVDRTFSPRLMMICDSEITIYDELSKSYYNKE